MRFKLSTTCHRSPASIWFLGPDRERAILVEGGLQGLLVSVGPAQRAGGRLRRTPDARSVSAGKRGISRQRCPILRGKFSCRQFTWIARQAPGGYQSRSARTPGGAHPPDCAQDSGHLGVNHLGGWKIKKTQVCGSKARSSDGNRLTHGSVARKTTKTRCIESPRFPFVLVNSHRFPLTTTGQAVRGAGR
jgi:hypothetical protein